MNTTSTTPLKYDSTITKTDTNTMKTKILSIILLLGLSFLASLTPDAVYAQVRERSVQLPQEIERDIVSLNQLIQKLEKDATDYERKIEDLVAKNHELYIEFRSGSMTGIERRRLAEQIANNRAQLNLHNYNYLSEVVTITDQIEVLSNRLESVDINISHIEDRTRETLNKFNETMTLVEGKIRRGAIIDRYGRLDVDAAGNQRELLSQYSVIVDTADRQGEIVQQLAKNATAQIENFGETIRGNTTFLSRQAENIGLISRLLLKRLSLTAMIEGEMVGLQSTFDSFHELLGELENMTNGFDIISNDMFILLGEGHPWDSDSDIDLCRLGHCNDSESVQFRSERNHTNKLDDDAIYRMIYGKNRNN